MATPPDRSRSKLLQLERQKQAAVINQFGKIRDKLQEQIADLLVQIEHLRRTEGNADPGLLIRKSRLQAILAGVEDDINAAAVRLAALTANAQDKAIDIAQDQAEATPGLETGFEFFDSAATREIVGSAIDGGPLVKIFSNISRPVQNAMFDALYFGVAAGLPNQAIARNVRDAIGGGAARAMTIVRTETNRAYREATRQFYDQTEGVKGWRWVSALDLRTCPICWALHGKVFKTSTKFGTHPNCRCTMVAVFPGDPKTTTGPEAFDKLTESQKIAILGPGRYKLYADGADLSDFVGQVRTPFGIGRTVKPIRETTYKPKPRKPVGPVPAKFAGVPIEKPIPKPKPTPRTTPSKTLAAAGEFDAAKFRAEFVKAGHDRRPPGFNGTGARLQKEYDDAKTAYYDTFSGAFYNEFGDAARDEKIRRQLAKDKSRAALDAHKVKAAAFAAEDRKLLKVANPIELEIIYTEGHFPTRNTDRRDRVASTIREVNDLIDRSAWPDKTILQVRHSKSRAKYDRGTIFVNTDSDADRRTIAHESAHGFEKQGNDILRMANEFLDYRTPGEKLVKLKKIYPNYNYRHDELTRPDKFKDAYVGKMYGFQGKQIFTEVVSMGMEYLYADPLEFALSDPEYFDFITTITRGKKWSPPK